MKQGLIIAIATKETSLDHASASNAMAYLCNHYLPAVIARYNTSTSKMYKMQLTRNKQTSHTLDNNFNGGCIGNDTPRTCVYKV